MAKKMEVDVEVKISPEKLWDTLRNSVTVFPVAFPELYKTIEVLEGDGKSPGSVRLLTFTEGNPFLVSKEKIEAVDDEKKTVTYSVIDGDLMKYYKSYKCHIFVEPKGEGSLVKWTCDYEPVVEDPNEPVMIKEFAVKTFKDIEEYNLKA
ncbi:hypothetical protein QQ045_018993 [Rhodiola kirilowii]